MTRVKGARVCVPVEIRIDVLGIGIDKDIEKLEGLVV